VAAGKNRGIRVCKSDIRARNRRTPHAHTDRHYC
jgi:hypothetical protein